MKHIIPGRLYSLKEISEKKFLWVHHPQALRRVIEKHKKILKPYIHGDQNGKRYLIKGENIRNLRNTVYGK